MELINFDYFVKRGTVLTEMARPVSTFKSPELNAAYGKLRDVCGKESGERRSSSIDNIVLPYLFQKALDYVTPEQEALWKSAKRSAPKRTAYAKTILNELINSGKLDAQQFARSWGRVWRSCGDLRFNRNGGWQQPG